MSLLINHRTHTYNIDKCRDKLLFRQTNNDRSRRGRFRFPFSRLQTVSRLRRRTSRERTKLLEVILGVKDTLLNNASKYSQVGREKKVPRAYSYIVCHISYLVPFIIHGRLYPTLVHTRYSIYTRYSIQYECWSGPIGRGYTPPFFLRIEQFRSITSSLQI